jgi:hypothetical protein
MEKNVRFVSTPVIENSEPNFRKGEGSGYSFEPPQRRQCAKELNRSRGRFAGESSHEAHWRPA